MVTAAENFFALEYDAFDSAWWEDLIIGPAHLITQNGFIRVTDAPGLGIEGLSEDLIREHGSNKGENVWDGTDDWDTESSLDRVWS